MWGEVYPKLIYGCYVENYSEQLLQNYTLCYEWVEKGWNCGHKILGFEIKLTDIVNGKIADDNTPRILELKKDLENPKYKADFSTFKVYYGVIGLDANQSPCISDDSDILDFSTSESDPYPDSNSDSVGFVTNKI